MKKAFIGVVVLIVALLVCLSTSATFVGEGLVGYLLIHLAVLAGAAYLMPYCFATVRSDIIVSVEIAISAVLFIGWIWFLIAAGIANVMAQRVFAWLMLSSLVLLVVALRFKYGKH